MKSPLKITNAAIGRVLEEVNLEYYRYEGDSYSCLNDIGLRFEGGLNLIFGCRGDGGVLVSRGELKLQHGIPGLINAYTESTDAFSGEQLVGANFKDSTLRLIFTNNILVLRNADEELVMMMGKNVN
jgi:hypothetical protein